MILYKLTDKNARSCGNTQWGPNITHKAKGKARQDLCTDGWIHAYKHPLLAVFFNPIHACYYPTRMWVSEGNIGKNELDLKVGCRKLTTVYEIPPPKLTLTQHLAFCLLMARTKIKNRIFLEWVENWLSNKDRSIETARYTITKIMHDNLSSTRPLSPAKIQQVVSPAIGVAQMWASTRLYSNSLYAKEVIGRDTAMVVDWIVHLRAKQAHMDSLIEKAMKY